jgi:CPA1 family monovalent cation:H+ antiporter
LKTGDEADQVRTMEEVERRLRLAAIRAERDELYRLGRSRKISDEIQRKLVREVDLLEARYGSAG